jgi:Zn-dependent peptidase ImmA (M78 family)
MSKIYDFLDNTKEEKQIRLKIRDIINSFRLAWAKKGIYDVFEIIENMCILIRKPLNNDEISGFATYLDENIIVFLNSSFTLGHERFTAAHELGHLVMHKDRLVRENLLTRGVDTEREANIFAVEFLMPDEGVIEIFHRIINVEANMVEPRHIISMHNYFKVSYKAMLKRLVFLDLCDIDKYEILAESCTKENAEKLQKLTIIEGYNLNLITKSNISYVSKEYEEIIRRNYESKKISYKRLEHLLDFIGKTPVQFGYEVFEDED